MSGARLIIGAGLLTLACLGGGSAATRDVPNAANATPAVPAASRPLAEAERFATPDAAADALVRAAETFDVPALIKIFGKDGEDVVLTGERAQDRQRALAFAAQAREKLRVSVDPRNATRAFVIVGEEDWPFAVPIVKRGEHWAFDAAAGRRELLYRRIGSNELDTIEILRGFVQAQYDYAYRQRTGYDVHQYAQHIISTPGKQDGLAWQTADGSWDGPIGQKVARAIEQGYTAGVQPYHGYYFKVLKGQGPHARLGTMDYVVEGAMIGGFALAAAPAEYRKTGVETFIVSQDGIVYQKDLGKTTLDQFNKMQRFDPDNSWKRVADE
jgi:Protein of unknown function (DUF2950)